MSETLKVVFDTQVFLRSLINPKSICGRLIFQMQADYQLYTAKQINQEILDVLNRPKIRVKFPQITTARINLIETVLELANHIEIKSEEIEALSRDPKDDIFLACAKLATADYLVSEDKDLLVLEKHHSTQIVNVVRFLSILENE